MRLSLRLKSALTANLAVAVPLALYLLWTGHIERRHLLASRVEVLRSLGELLAEEAALARSTGQSAHLGEALDRLARRQPELEVYLLDREERVWASTRPARLGSVLDEPSIRDALAGRTDFAWDLGHHGELPVLGVTLPIPGTAGSLGAVHIAEPQSLLQRAVREARQRAAAFVALLVLLVGGLVTWSTDRLVLRRVARLLRRLRGTEWCGSGDEPGGRDELAVLEGALETLLAEVDRVTDELRRTLAEKEVLLRRVQGFNEELSAQVEAARREILSMQAALLEKERLSTIGELAAALAHEVRNPLQIIRATADLLRRHHPEAAEELADVIEEVNRLDRLVRELLDYARPLAPRSEAVAVEPLVEEALAEALPPGARPPGLELELDLEPGLRLRGDELLLDRLLVNLLANAREALEEAGGGLLRVAAGRDAGGCWIEVADAGPGIPPEDLERVARPFFSRKAAGTGMGLALCRRIAEAHGGRLEIASPWRDGRGTRVRLRLPCGEDEGGGE